MRLLFAGIFLAISITVFCQSPEELNNKAVALMDNDQYQEALPLLDNLVTSNHQNTIFRYNRAVTLFNLKRYREALADYKILHKLLPTEGEYAFQVGNAYEQLDSADRALSFYNEAIRLIDDNFLFFFKRGTIYLKQNNFEKAEADYNSALYLNPKHDNSLHNRGIARYKMGQQKKACEDWCKAFQLGNSYSSSHLKINCEKFDTCKASK